MIPSWVQLLAISCFARTFISAKMIQHANSSKILLELLVNYHKAIIPNKPGEPLDVYVQIYISDMVPLKQLHMHFSLDVFFRTIWVDERLAFNKSSNSSIIVLPGTIKDKIWVPDLYVPTQKEAVFHKATTLNSAVHIYGNGEIYSSQRLSFTSFCPMDFLYFPFDVQHCNFTISSYAYPADFMRLKWKEPNPILTGKKSELHMRQFSTAKFQVTKLLSVYQDVGKTGGGFYELVFMFTFYRNLPAYIMRDYLPSIFTVILSWLSFWIDYRSTPARVSLGITTVLTMVTLLIKTNDDDNSQVTFRSIELYMFVCNLYVFFATIEYAVVGIIEARSVRRQAKPKNKSNSIELGLLNIIAREGSIENYLKDNFKVESPKRENIVSPLDVEREGRETSEINRRRSLSGRRKSLKSKKDDYRNDIMLKLANTITYDTEKRMVEPHKLDKICRIVFPSSFIMLNVAYFLFHYSQYAKNA